MRINLATTAWVVGVVKTTMKEQKLLSQIYVSEQSAKWRTFLIDFAKCIGKIDAEVYIDTGKKIATPNLEIIVKS